MTLANGLARNPLLRGIWDLLGPDTLSRIRKLASPVGRLDYAPAAILMAEDSRLERDVRLRSCSKEPETVRWIEETFRVGDVLYDVGANVGAYALVAARHGSTGASVVAFEPSFPTFHQLCRNIRLNGCQDAVTPLPVALSDETGLSTLQYSSVEAGASEHRLGGSVSPGAVHRQPLLTYRLDDLIAQMKLRTPTHLKLDVDGHELRVLRGAERTLAAATLRTLLVELTDGKPDAREIHAILRLSGFSVASRHPISAVSGGEMFNVIFRKS